MLNAFKLSRFASSTRRLSTTPPSSEVSPFKVIGAVIGECRYVAEAAMSQGVPAQASTAENIAKSLSKLAQDRFTPEEQTQVSISAISTQELLKKQAKTPPRNR